MDAQSNCVSTQMAVETNMCCDKDPTVRLRGEAICQFLSYFLCQPLLPWDLYNGASSAPGLVRRHQRCMLGVGTRPAPL